MAMWTCAECSYVNDELAEACRRCGALKPVLDPGPGTSEDVTVVSAAQAPHTEHTHSPIPEAAPPGVDELLQAEIARQAVRGRVTDTGEPQLASERPRRIDPLALTLLLVAIVGLVGVAYLAWSRGYFDTVLGREEAEAPLVVNVADSSGALDLPADDPLAALEDDDIPGLRPYRDYIEILRETDEVLASVRVETEAPGTLTEATRQQLFELENAGNALLDEYEAFEQRAERDTEPKLQPYQDLLRGQFIQRMDQVLALAGQAYAEEESPNHRVYLLSDAFVEAVSRYGRADSQVLHDRWLEAIHSKEQRLLGEQYAPQLETLQGQLDELKRIHQEYAAIFAESPEYKVRAGTINVVAEELLTHYDALATKVEELAEAHQQYVATLDAEMNVERAKEISKEFLALAQEDHMYAFSETYMIYEKDKNLEHPAYERLRVHYEWAKEHWPDIEGRYIQVFRMAEGRWADRWAPSD